MLIAVDPSTTRTGWAVFDYGGKLWDFGYRDHKGSLIAKLGQLEALIHRVTFDRAIIRLALESQFVGRHATPALVVSRASGAVIAGFSRSLTERHVLDLGVLEEIAPASVKKALTGNGRAKKPEMVAAVEKRYGIILNNDDEADAIAIGFAILKRGEDVG